MTNGGFQQKKIHLRMVDKGQSGSQDSRKTMDLSGKTYISHISDPNTKGYTNSNSSIMHIWYPLILGCYLSPSLRCVVCVGQNIQKFVAYT